MRSTGARRTGWSRILWSLPVLLLAVGPIPPVAGATAEDANGTGGAAPFEVVGAIDVVPDGWNAGTNSGAPSPLVLWPEGRRAYQLAGSAPDRVVPIDLDTFEPVTTIIDGEPQRIDSGPLVPALTAGGFRHAATWAGVIPVDSDRGVMFLPHRMVGPVAGVPRPLCTGGGGQAPSILGGNSCLGGIHVLSLVDDAFGTPEGVLRNPIPFEPLGVDGANLVSPALVAMSHTSELGGSMGKLHLLVQEQAHWTGPADDSSVAPRDATVPHFVFQIDVATGQPDWVERAGGCSSFRDHPLAVNTRFTTADHVIFASSVADDRAVYIGCYGPSNAGTVVRMSLGEDPTAGPFVTEAFPGPPSAHGILADPDARRIWLGSVLGGDEAWWLFDGGVSAYLGVVGVGPAVGLSDQGRVAAVDPGSGRLYAFQALDTNPNTARPGMLYVTDGRRVPVPQMTLFPDLPWQDLQHVTERTPDGVDYVRTAEGDRTGNLHTLFQNPLMVEPATETRPRRLYYRAGKSAGSHRWYVIEDRLPAADRIPDAEALERQALEDPPATDDVDLHPDLTQVSFTGTARSYGVRTLLLGGSDAVVFPGRVLTTQEAVYYRPGATGGQPLNPCGGVSREFVFGLSGSQEPAGAPGARLQPGGSAGRAIPAVADLETRRDLADPVGRCGLPTLEAVMDAWGVDQGTVHDLLSSLGVRDPGLGAGDAGGEQRPGYDGEVFDRHVACSAPEFRDDGSVVRTSSDARGDDSLIGPAFAAEVDCVDDDRTSGSARARLVSAGPVRVADAYADYQVVRDDETGRIESRAHAVARGISILQDVLDGDGVPVGRSSVTIDKVEARAVAWATGRARAGDAAGGCANDDRATGAGTCLVRSITGVTVVDGITGQIFSCDACHDNQDQMVQAMQRALGDSWRVLLREPDAILAEGFGNGTLAAVQKREIDEFADVVLRGDLLKTLPGLELTRFNDNSQGRGRQVYQFAGVELGTVFTRQCLGVIDGGQCVSPPVPLAEVTVSLSDAVDGRPLAGGRFQLTQTSVVEGATGLDAPVSCVTDGSGRCEMVGLPAGGYLLTQTEAPGDYGPAEALPLTLCPGCAFDVTVTNVRQVASVVVGLTDLDGVPLAGGMFQLHTDRAGDGVVGLDDVQAAVCTTGLDGTCTMADLPLGGYVLSQAAAPDGFVPVDDRVPFVLDEAGQVATIVYSNAPAGAGGGQDGSVGGVAMEATPMPRSQPVAVQRPPSPQVADPEGGADPGVAVPAPPLGQQLADTLELLRRNPVHAAAFGLLLALGAAAAGGPLRRRLLLLVAS